MFRLFCAHLYKSIHTPLMWLLLLWPLPVIGAFIAYYRVSAWSIENQATGFFQAISLLMIGLITLACTVLSQQEQRAGNGFNILAVGSSRLRTFYAIFFQLAVWVTGGLLLAVTGFALCWGQLTPVVYQLTTLLMLLPLPALLLIQLWIALKLGQTWSIGAGAVFFLIGALGVTGLMDQSWYAIPPTWAPRFASLMITDAFYPDQIIPIAAELRHGLGICFLATIILLIVVPLWFRRWDGKSEADDV